MKVSLDDIAAELHKWSESLWEPVAEYGGFRMNEEVGVNLLSSTDIAWIRYATNDPDLTSGRRDEWIGYLCWQQDPVTGRFSYGPAGGGHSDGHAMWHTVRALNILGGQILHFPEYLRSRMTPQGLREWFRSINWSSLQSNHHEVLGTVPLIVSLGDPKMVDVLYEELTAQQDPILGTWPSDTGQTNISRTFAYTVLYRAAGRMPAQPEKIVDRMLSLQRPSGFWDEPPGFLSMDAAFLLVRLPRLLSHREAEAKDALRRLLEALTAYYAARVRELLRHTHRTLAVVQTFGLLQEAFPEELPSARPYRFDWEDSAMYRCDVIARNAAEDQAG